MQFRLTHKNSSRVRRQGLSIVEFIGCFVAMGGGMLLGAMYLGIDIQAVATDTLERARGVMSEDAPAESEEEALKSGKTQSTNSQKTDSPPGETGNQETAELPTTVDSNQTTTKESTAYPLELTEAEQARATQAYWKVLAASVGEELAGRELRGKDVSNWQMFEHLEHRQVGHQRAVDQIKQLDDRGVDSKVLDHASQVLGWHVAGAKLYRRALDLITDGPSADLLGPFAQSWQSAATQHRMEEKLVQVKHLSVAGYLNHAYKELGPFIPAAAP